jgi:SRSO17 transposase
LTGICIRDKNQSAFGIANALGLKSHDALTDMLIHKSWSATLLMLQLLNEAMKLSSCSSAQSWLIIDDVILPKRRSIHTDGVYWDYDYVNRRHILCLRLVVLAWSNGVVCIPVAFALYYKKGSDYLQEHKNKFRTKNQLARILVHQVLRKGLKFDYLTFDSWYASADNFRFFNRLNITFITSLRSNRKLCLPYSPIISRPKRRLKYPRWYKLNCSQWAAQKPYVKDYPFYYKVSARARKSLVFVDEVDFYLKLVCIKNYANNKAFKDMHTKLDKRSKDPNKYLITNDISLTTPQVINYYRSRWTIEVLFRESKQHLALGKCQAYKMLEPHLRHTAMVFFAFTLFELIKSKANEKNLKSSTIGDLKRYLQAQHIVELNGQYQVLDISQTKLDWDKVNRLTNALDLNNMILRKTQYVLNFENDGYF